MKNGSRRQWVFVWGERQIGMRSGCPRQFQQNGVTINDRRHQTEARRLLLWERVLPLLNKQGFVVASRFVRKHLRYIILAIEYHHRCYQIGPLLSVGLSVGAEGGASSLLQEFQAQDQTCLKGSRAPFITKGLSKGITK